MNIIKKDKKSFKEGLIVGIGWAFGVTIGFAIISTLIVALLRTLGGVPVIGNFISDVLGPTLENLSKRTPLSPN